MPSTARFLVPVDFSPSSEGAARYARSLACHAGGELTLLHVLDLSEYDFSPIQIEPERARELMAGRTQAAHAALDTLSGGASAGVPVRRLVVNGDPGEQILHCAVSEAADLIVMPTHGFDPIRRFLLGSVASKVLHGAGLPVLTGVHFESQASAAALPRHIVCGLDLGPESARVLEWSAHLAAALAARLTLVHATPAYGGSAGDFIAAGWRVQLDARVRERMTTLRQGLSVPADVAVVPGDPHQALRSTVERLGADLLVIGRGATAGGAFGRLRAHAYAIIRASPCPVLSV